jgi:hypothetical protein
MNTDKIKILSALIRVHLPRIPLFFILQARKIGSSANLTLRLLNANAAM